MKHEIKDNQAKVKVFLERQAEKSAFGDENGLAKIAFALRAYVEYLRGLERIDQQNLRSISELGFSSFERFNRAYLRAMEHYSPTYSGMIIRP